MGQPVKFRSGTTPIIADTQWTLWAKRLIALGGKPLNSDTKRMLKGKIDRIQKGLSGTNTGF